MNNSTFFAQSGKNTLSLPHSRRLSLKPNIVVRLKACFVLFQPSVPVSDDGRDRNEKYHKRSENTVLQSVPVLVPDDFFIRFPAGKYKHAERKSAPAVTEAKMKTVPGTLARHTAQRGEKRRQTAAERCRQAPRKG